MYFFTLATLVSKNTSKMSRNSSRVEKYLDKHSVKWIARLKCITARLYKYHKYINSYYPTLDPTTKYTVLRACALGRFLVCKHLNFLGVQEGALFSQFECATSLVGAKLPFLFGASPSLNTYLGTNVLAMFLSPSSRSSKWYFHLQTDRIDLPEKSFKSGFSKKNLF